MLNYYTDMLKNWKNFNDKLSRHDYWRALLTMLVILAILLWFSNKIPALNIIVYLYSIAMILPYLAATVRRLHDVGKSGWFLLLILIPVIGWVWLFVELIQY